MYLACSADGFAPCLEDDSAGEPLEWLGGVNVAGTRATAPRRPLTIEEIKACSSSRRGDRWAWSRRTSARESSVAVGGRGGCWSRVPISGTPLQLGSAAAVGQSAARAHMACLCGVRARTRRRVRRRRPRVLQGLLSSGSHRSAVAETRRSWRRRPARRTPVCSIRSCPCSSRRAVTRSKSSPSAPVRR